MTNAEATIRPIRASDDERIARIIREVLTSFGVTGGDSAFADSEIDGMSAAYASDRARYFVLEIGGFVVGGAGFGPLAGGNGSICELRKMYLLPEVRGHGHGRRLLSEVLDAARAANYGICYLETVPQMIVAQRLYESLGFRRLSEAMGSTGHGACDVWYARDL